ncbi:MAG: AAA family ATPase [Chthoniobacterales bacterium]
MHKTIALFNHKGGVSKTTTTFNLGWMLAEKGHRVVMIDTDPQCNLTGLVLGYDSTQDFDRYYAEHPSANVKDALAPAFESQPRPIQTVECVAIPGRDNLFLVPGHVNLSEYEVTLGIAQELSGSIQTLRNLPGAFHYFVTKVAEAQNADFILVDMSPSLGAMNQNFLMTSDFFLIPTAPDYFSVMAIESLTAILPKWMQWAKRASGVDALKSATYPFPELRLKLLGTVIQRYRLMKGKATIGFQTWINQINDKVRDRLAPSLAQYDGLLRPEAYAYAGVDAQGGYCLSIISDFNSMITISQDHQTPVFALTQEMFGHEGAVLDQDITKRDEFRQTFSDLADRVVSLVS